MRIVDREMRSATLILIFILLIKVQQNMSNILDFMVNGPEDMIVEHGDVSGEVVVSYLEGMSHKMNVIGIFSDDQAGN